MTHEKRQIRPIVTGRGACYASKRIAVGGARVGFLYREASEDPAHSGWWFLSGDETPEECDDPASFGIYDVNTIANLDPDVIELLDHPAGCEYDRDEHGRWRRLKTPGDVEIECVTLPDVGGECDLGHGWKVTLDGRFSRRLEAQDQILWRSGTILRFCSLATEQDPRAAFEALVEHIPERARDVRDATHEGVRRVTYELDEASAGGSVPALQALVLGGGELLLVQAVPHDREAATTITAAVGSLRRSANVHEDPPS